MLMVHLYNRLCFSVEKRDNADQESSKKDDKEDTKPEAKEIKFDETFHTWG